MAGDPDDMKIHTGPFELHQPPGSRRSPLLDQFENGELQLISGRRYGKAERLAGLIQADLLTKGRALVAGPRGVIELTCNEVGELTARLLPKRSPNPPPTVFDDSEQST